MLGISLPAAAAPVQGFSYTLPRLTPPVPGLLRYLQQDRAKTYKDYAPLFSDPDFADQDFSSFESSTDWTLNNRLPGLIILIAGRSSYTGGAHGFAFADPLIWDVAADRPVRFAGLFSNPAAARALLTPAYCRALDRERRVRRGAPTAPDEMFGDCPNLFDGPSAYPTKPVNGKYSRIAIAIAPYVAGPYVEGGYDLEIFIPKGLKPLVKPQYQALFPG